VCPPAGGRLLLLPISPGACRRKSHAGVQMSRRLRVRKSHQ
jgi:hypothetical protein